MGERVFETFGSDHIQLHAGEMTAQELRNVKAVVTAIATAIRNQGDV